MMPKTKKEPIIETDSNDEKESDHQTVGSKYDRWKRVMKQKQKGQSDKKKEEVKEEKEKIVTSRPRQPSFDRFDLLKIKIPSKQQSFKKPPITWPPRNKPKLKRQPSIRSMALKSHYRFINAKRKAVSCSCAMERLECLHINHSNDCHPLKSDILSILLSFFLNYLEKTFFNFQNTNGSIISNYLVHSWDKITLKSNNIMTNFLKFINSNKFTSDNFDSNDWKRLKIMDIKELIKNYKNTHNLQKIGQEKQVSNMHLDQLILAYSDIGTNSQNEDTFVVVNDVENLLPLYNPDAKEDDSLKIKFLGVFDGHGGKGCANYLKKFLLGNIIKRISNFNDLETLKKAIIDGVDETDRSFLQFSKDLECQSGSTATFTFMITKNLKCKEKIEGFADDEIVFVTGNIGDSSMLISCDDKMKYFFNYTLHKPNNKQEKERIVSKGGIVTHFYGSARVNGKLNVSRAMGDLALKKFIISTPNVDVVRIKKSKSKNYYVVLASDGLWDKVTYNATQEFIKEHKNEKDYHFSKELCQLAKSKNSRDNITVIFTFLDTLEDQKL